jgi:transposase
MARIEIFRGQARRRWSDEEKRQLVAETFMPGTTVHAVAQRHGVNTSQLFTWRKRYRGDLGFPAPAAAAFARSSSWLRARPRRPAGRRYTRTRPA